MTRLTSDAVSIAPKPIRIVTPAKRYAGRYDALIADLFAAFGAGDNGETNRLMLLILEAIEGDSRSPSTETKSEINRAVHAVLTVFASPLTTILESRAAGFVWFNPLLANAVAAGCEATTDPYLAMLSGQPQEAFKTAVLVSPRNVGKPRMDALFAASPELASTWFCTTFRTAFSGNVSEHTRRRLIEMSHKLDDRFVAVKDIQEPYFLVTYLGDTQAEKNVKGRINEAVRRACVPIDPGKASKRVAIASDNWLKGHSVHRTLKGYVDALQGHYDVDLIHAIRKPEDQDNEGFAEVIRLDYDGTNLGLDKIQGRGYAAVIYPDIGMTGWSIVLANHRVAPVQAMMTGHPVSTFGAEIDYFISGELTEDWNQTYYSERQVRLPGFGAIHERPTYEPRGTVKDFDGILINASWYGQKIAFEWCQLVDEVIRKSGVKCKVQLFAGGAATSRGAFSQFLRDIGKAMPSTQVEVFPHIEYGDYMAKMEAGDFAIDCFPFAGSNTVSDNLWLRKPVVCLAGKRWFNGIGPAMLRAAGLGELAAVRVEEFQKTLTRMLTDEVYRASMIEKTRSADLDSTIYRREGGEEFREWLDSVTAPFLADRRTLECV